MINVTFETLDEMLHFANRLAGLGQADFSPKQESSAPVISVTQTQTQQMPVQQSPIQAQAAPVQQAPAQTPAPVQTTTPSYTMDDLAGAAVPLMESGRQADLLNLLAQFGVESLPALPKEQYGAFATALRGLGAQI
nr:hypothetical protein [uncultured Clostridium sp.]